MALLLLAAHWAAGSGRPLTVATVDHGLRPEAAAEAEAVAAICARLGVPHCILRWEHAPGAPRPGMAKARIARHALLTRWAAGEGAQCILLGHTEDDRIETFLIRAQAGSDWYGLAGMGLQGPSPLWSPAWSQGAQVMLARPLLLQSRASLQHWLAGLGAGWVDDPTNHDLNHVRTRMRRLASRLPAADRSALIRVLDRLALLKEATLAAARQVLDASRFDAEGRMSIPLEAWRSVGPGARARCLEAVLLSLTGAPAPPRSSRIAGAVGRMDAAGDALRSLSLGGAVIRVQTGVVSISVEPLRRSAVRKMACPAVAASAARLSALLSPQWPDAVAGGRSRPMPAGEIWSHVAAT